MVNMSDNAKISDFIHIISKNSLKIGLLLLWIVILILPILKYKVNIKQARPVSVKIKNIENSLTCVQFKFYVFILPAPLVGNTNFITR